MNLKYATYTIEFSSGQTEEVETVSEVQSHIEKIDDKYNSVNYTLVYQCQEDNQSYAEQAHEYTEKAKNWSEIDNYAIEDADPCQRCRGDYGIINMVVLDRIEVNEDTASITAIHINY